VGDDHDADAAERRSLVEIVVVYMPSLPSPNLGHLLVLAPWSGRAGGGSGGRSDLA
jgi:hypothetical protein